MSPTASHVSGNEYRISYEQQGDDLILQMGPQHPSTHGVLRLELVTDGELVKYIRPHIGYLHRCFEKHAEALTYPHEGRDDTLTDVVVTNAEVVHELLA